MHPHPTSAIFHFAFLLSVITQAKNLSCRFQLVGVKMLRNDLNFGLRRAFLGQSLTALGKCLFRHLVRTKPSYSEDLIPHSSILRLRDLRYSQFCHFIHGRRHFCQLTFLDFFALRILARTLPICDSACLISLVLDEGNYSQCKYEL